MRILLLFAVAALLWGSAYFNVPYLRAPGEFVANTILGVGFTSDELRARYRVGPLPILIVPGHDNDSWGTQFKELKEADLNLILGYHLFNILKEDPRFIPMIIRAPSGEYTRWFEHYMDENRVAVERFRKQSQLKTSYFLRRGLYTTERLVHHNPAADNVSLALYAINKWGNDHDVPIILHLHFNDYYPRRTWEAGEYSGFSIYVPEDQLPNAHASYKLAETLAERLGFVVGPSNLPAEKGPIIPDQELIAVGSNGSRNGASLVIEYSYIYEPQLHNIAIRQSLLRELAHQTYAGLKAFFEPTAILRGEIDATTLLPHEWSSQRLSEGSRGRDVLALQSVLRVEGFYPPSGLSLASCPLSGYYGSCTTFAVKAFQRSRVFFPSGIADTRTLSVVKSIQGE